MNLYLHIKKIVLEGGLPSLFKEVAFKASSLRGGKTHRLFNQAYRGKDWQGVIRIGEDLLREGLANPDFYQKIGSAYLKLGQADQGGYLIQKSLEERLGGKVEDLLGRVDQVVFQEGEIKEAIYGYRGGFVNLGMIDHDGRYISKIVPTNYPFDHYAHKERFFHAVISRHCPGFNTLTPEMVGFFEMKKEKLAVMSFEKIDHCPIEKASFYEVVQISKKIGGQMSQKEALNFLKITDHGKAIPLSSLAHKRSTHALVFKNMRKKIRHLDQKSKLEACIERMEDLVMTHKLYDQIRPKDHYVFCHRDFSENNILYDPKKGRYCVIDWSSYGLGLHGYDLAKFFWTTGLSFAEIEGTYIDEIFKETQDPALHKIFFAYNLCAFWIQRVDLDQIDDQLESCLSLGLDYMEALLIRNKP